jgi:hypothetical protein
MVKEKHWMILAAAIYMLAGLAAAECNPTTPCECPGSCVNNFTADICTTTDTCPGENTFVATITNLNGYTVYRIAFGSVYMGGWSGPDVISCPDGWMKNPIDNGSCYTDNMANFLAPNQSVNITFTSIASGPESCSDKKFHSLAAYLNGLPNPAIIHNVSVHACANANQTQITRTQGFWATHYKTAKYTWLMVPEADRMIGTHNMGDGINDVKELEGGFWADIAKTSKKKARTQLDSARMQLLQQLLAAILNVQAFGAYGTTDGGLISQAKAAFAGSNLSEIQYSAQALDDWNNAGDAAPFPEGFRQGKADPKASKAAANASYWDILP